MYKLLPEEQQQKIAHEYSGRRMVVALIALILVIIIGMVGLFPSYMLSSARRKEVLERIRIMGDLALQEDELALQKWLADFNLKLRTLTPKADTNRPTKLIEAVLDEKTAGVSLTGFTWKKSGDKAVLSVSGIARDRQALIALESSLNASRRFSEVTLPVSNLARDKDIDFRLELSPIETP